MANQPIVISKWMRRVLLVGFPITALGFVLWSLSPEGQDSWYGRPGLEGNKTPTAERTELPPGLWRRDDDVCVMIGETRPNGHMALAALEPFIDATQELSHIGRQGPEQFSASQADTLSVETADWVCGHGKER